MKEDSIEHRRGLVWVALGASLWGTDTPLRRPLTAVLSSTNIVLNEHLILSAVLLPVFWRARAEWSKLGPRQWGAITAIGWGGSGLATVCFTEAIKIGNPTTAVLLQKTQPLFASLLAALLLAETLGRRFWASLALALVAGYLISVGDRPETLWHPLQALQAGRSVAALLALAAAALWGASTVLGRFLLRGLSFQIVTALRILLAAPFLLALAILGHQPLWVELNAGQMLSLVTLALVPGLAALLLYYYGLRRTRASRAAIAELCFPATATLLNWVFLGARISAIQGAGFLLLWGVILHLERRRV
jgi:drug/metabolite transporter (DMT)-like permease